MPISQDQAFSFFINDINKWWPREYTWSKDKLMSININAKTDGLCTEIGPFGFRCDWGRVVHIEENTIILLKWQISPQRVPVPDPEKASDISIHFKSDANGSSKIEFEHFNFENHGEGAQDYRKAMESPEGWDYILNCYSVFVSNLVIRGI